MAAAAQLVMVTAPPEATAGQVLQITAPSGEQMFVAMPDGVSAGEQFRVHTAATAAHRHGGPLG